MIRTRTYSIFKSKGIKKHKKLKEYLGCTSEFARDYIQSLFTHDMNWSNQGKYWDIDHIIPLATAQTEDEIYKLSHYTNLRPLSKKIIEKKQIKI